MPLSLQENGSQKDSLAISLAAILLSDSNIDISADNLQSVLSAASVKVPAYLPPLYATYIEKSGGISRFFSGPSAGGGGGGPAPAAAASAGAPAGAPAAKKEEKPKEEEVDALDGGMDMFGGGGGGGGDY